MAVLRKELTLYPRGNDSNLIPQEVDLEVDEQDKINYPELVGQKIKVIPMTRGEMRLTFGSELKPDQDTDAELVEKYCKEPLYTKDEIQYMKPVVVKAIAATIMRESGLILPKKKKQDGFENDEFGKN